MFLTLSSSLSTIFYKSIYFIVMKTSISNDMTTSIFLLNFSVRVASCTVKWWIVKSWNEFLFWKKYAVTHSHQLREKKYKENLKKKLIVFVWFPLLEAANQFPVLFRSCHNRNLTRCGSVLVQANFSIFSLKFPAMIRSLIFKSYLSLHVRVLQSCFKSCRHRQIRGNSGRAAFSSVFLANLVALEILLLLFCT